VDRAGVGTRACARARNCRVAGERAGPARRQAQLDLSVLIHAQWISSQTRDQLERRRVRILGDEPTYPARPKSRSRRLLAAHSLPSAVSRMRLATVSASK